MPPQGDRPGPREGERTSSIAPRVFWPSAVVILGFVLFAVIGQKTAADAVATVQSEVIGNLSWFYMALVSLFVIFCLWVGIGRYGDIRLGKDGERPEFSVVSWLAMLFAAGMGIGLVFWGVAEPLNFFDAPRPGIGSSDAAKSEFAMVQTFLHWGIHPWAIYVVVGLAVAYSVHRKGRPVSIRWALEPVFGDRIKGVWGDVIDSVAVIGTLFGVATSLGFGVMQVASGMDFLGWVDDGGSKTLLVVLIVCITGVATLSVVTGIGKGIKWLSNANMGIAALIMLFVLIAGPTLYIANTLVQDTGGYLQNLLSLSFDTGAAHGEDGTSWVNAWTVFYWGWWISWAPFVGIFIARISRGRTVREFVCGVLLVPTLLTFVWFSIFGGTAVFQQATGKHDYVGEAGVSTNNALFEMLDTLPGGTFVAGVAILLIVLFFVTSSDSGSYVVDMLASGGDPNPPTWSRVFWALTEGAVAIALLLASGSGGTASLDTLKTVAILVALPFSFVMIGMCVATLRSFRQEREAYLAAKAKREQDRMVDEAVAALEEGLENGTLGAEGTSKTSTTKR
ncbi:BCCT family transporter [Streptomyces sp. DSM 42041]|uniref:BCCT family transporter n=1 Tax=Streptomyces hazeniae TaxID=3075538 RepID=A0ABU2NUQ0_9ACTN|nr:BCCT family transporter [Streptomyces sp. DSM 42041]MDT0380712.1 BCCT family transporter [Streptomyces sp. DSM 42041]